MRKNDTSIKKLKDLKGREIAVRPESSYLETIHELNRKHKLGIVPLLVPGDMETYEIIRLVSEGKYNYTIADSNILNLECRRISGIKSALDLKEKQHYGWMTRKNDRELEKAVNDFFRKEHKGAFFNIIYRKYFNNPELIKKHKKIFHSVKKGGDLSPYDSIIKKYSSQYGFNWCFIASQVFQESRFKADIRARDGGMGLMQLMPFTAKELDCKDPFNPADNVNAGVKYMCRLKKRVGKRVPHGREANLLCFALASYNGGYGHLLDARKLAEKQKLSPDIWYGNVEEAYKLLSRKKYATRARYGYCNSDIITNYVNDILLRFYHYKQNYPEN
jgi:membrane-bound lytic murein transglycosylase F